MSPSFRMGTGRESIWYLLLLTHKICCIQLFCSYLRLYSDSVQIGFIGLSTQATTTKLQLNLPGLALCTPSQLVRAKLFIPQLKLLQLVPCHTGPYDSHGMLEVRVSQRANLICLHCVHACAKLTNRDHGCLLA